MVYKIRDFTFFLFWACLQVQLHQNKSVCGYYDLSVIMNYSFDILYQLMLCACCLSLLKQNWRWKQSCMSTAVQPINRTSHHNDFSSPFPSFFYPFYHLTWADIEYQTEKERNWWNILISFPYLPWFSSWHPSVGIRKRNIRYKIIFFILFCDYAEEEKTDLATLVFVCTKLMIYYIQETKPLDVVIHRQAWRQDEVWGGIEVDRQTETGVDSPQAPQSLHL